MPKNRKAELTLIPDPEAADVAALFESLTGGKPTEAEMREVRKTLAEDPRRSGAKRVSLR